jgi:hypothetical protein
MECDYTVKMLSDDIHRQGLKSALMHELLSAAPDPVPAPTMLRPPGPPALAYASRSTTEQRQIWLVSENITTAWDVSLPSTVFPADYHPDPDPSNWGLPLLTAILRLAERTRTSKLMSEGVDFVCVREHWKGQRRCVFRQLKVRWSELTDVHSRLELN